MNESCPKCGYTLNVFGGCLRCDGATVHPKPEPDQPCKRCGGSKAIDSACYGGNTKYVIPCPDCQPDVGELLEKIKFIAEKMQHKCYPDAGQQLMWSRTIDIQLKCDQALTHIESLQAQLRWIPVGERLPKEAGRYTVSDGELEWHTWYKEEDFNPNGWWEQYSRTITYWMEPITLPKGE